MACLQQHGSSELRVRVPWLSRMRRSSFCITCIRDPHIPRAWDGNPDTPAGVSWLKLDRSSGINLRDIEGVSALVLPYWTSGDANGC